MDRDNLYYASVDGVLYSKDLNTIIRFPKNKDVAKYKIPTSVTTIGDASFSDCKFLKNVDIPDTVTIIGHQAFEWCEFLQDLEIPNSVISIGNYAFWNCKSLQSLSLPNSLTAIGEYTFDGCDKMTNLRCDCDFFSHFEKHKSLKNVIIGSNVTMIRNYSFWGSSASIESIELPSSITYIGEYAFSCGTLRYIHLRIDDIEQLSVHEDAFSFVDFDKCVLYIPSGTRWAYKHHPVFGQFKNIEIDDEED